MIAALKEQMKGMKKKKAPKKPKKPSSQSSSTRTSAPRAPPGPRVSQNQLVIQQADECRGTWVGRILNGVIPVEDRGRARRGALAERQRFTASLRVHAIARATRAGTLANLDL